MNISDIIDIVEMNSDLVQLFQYLISTYWTFLRADWPIVKREKHHRSEVKDIIGIEMIRNYVLERLGYIPVYFFLSIMFSSKDHPGPYRGVEKGLLILYHLLTGVSTIQMGQYIPKTSFHDIYRSFYVKQLEWLDNILDTCLATMFSNVKLRVMRAKILNPDEFKHVTLMIDGHDSRATYMNATNPSAYYSYKLKKSGFRTQVAMDINGMILFVSKAAPCSTNNDGSMLASMDLVDKVSRFDVVAMDGGYNLFIDRIIQANPHLARENFVTPVRKSMGVDLDSNEILYNQLLGGFRSSIESRFGELGHLFHRFNGTSVIRVSDDAVFTVQLKLACVLSNMKKFVALGNLEHSVYHTYWMQTGFDYYTGSPSTSSVYDVADTLSIADRRGHKQSMEVLQRELLSLSLEDIHAQEASASTSTDMDHMQDDEPVSYDVERIIDHRDTLNGTEYKVKWIGYDNRYNRWITQDMFDGNDLVEEYMQSLQ